MLQNTGAWDDPISHGPVSSCVGTSHELKR